MFILKEQEFLTPEEQREVISLQAELTDHLYPPIAVGDTDNMAEKAKEYKQYEDALNRRNALLAAAEERYIASIIDDKSKILANAAEIINAVSQRDYRNETAPQNKRMKEDIAKCKKYAAEATDEKYRKIWADLAKNNAELLNLYYSFNFQSVRNFLDTLVSTEREALRKGGHSVEELDKMLDARAAQFYPNKDHKRTIKPEQLEAYNETAGIEQLSLFERRFMPMLQGQLTTGLMPISTKGLQADKLRGGATEIKKSDTHTIVIKGYDKLQGELGVSAKKLLDTGVVMLTQRNSYGTDKADPVVYIDLLEYAKANGYKVDRQIVETPEEAAKQEARIADTLKELKIKLRQDIEYISSIYQTATETRGKDKLDFRMLRLLSSGSVLKGKIRLNFDPEAAQYLSQAYIMQYPIALLKHDNRNPNSYAIGRKIAYHNSMDNNQIAGTANTLSVLSLLEAAPEIISLSELQGQGRRDWKRKIKAKLEKALDDNISIGYLSRWEYHSTSKGRLTREQAAELSPEEYHALYVDFVVVDAPDQSERLAAKSERKRLAAAAADKPKRKRGRPKKSE